LTELALGARAGRRGRVVARLGFGLAVLAGVILALVPLGWCLGLWSFGVSFRYLMVPVPFIAAGAFLVSLLAAFGWGNGSVASRAATLFGLVLAAALVWYPLHFYALVRPLPLLHNTPLPPIHDITADVTDPPQFAATLAARAAEQGASPVYAGAALARLQQNGYPDIAPLMTKLPPAEVFRQALATAEAMPRWTIVSSNPETGLIEGSARTLFIGFADDFVIRVRAAAGGSRVDMRSESRQRRGDLGANAARVRDYMAALKRRLG
jgi:uncharacterized protein (DUF1499 family)